MTTKKRQNWIFIGLSMLLFSGILAGCSTPRSTDDLKLCVQSCTFHRFPLDEALDKTQMLGIKYIEIFPGHRLGEKYGDQLFDYHMDSATRKAVKQMASDRGIQIVATGVLVPQTPDEWPLIFAFAQDMGMELITCEPALSDWDLVEKLSKASGIKVAVHNHPQPSHYWTPDSLLQQIADRDKLIGSCSDVGHWRREGLDQLECLKKLEGRIAMLHFKDISTPQEGSHDVIWGTGILDMPAMLKELKRQRFSGYLSVEYEYNWDNSLPDIRKCIANYNKARSAL